VDTWFCYASSLISCSSWGWRSLCTCRLYPATSSVSE